MTIQARLTPHPTQVNARIVVLLPLYNGAKFLRPQLDSILAQSFENTLILCRDDGSRDDSPQIVAEYASLHPERFVLLQDSLGNLGARGSFSCLMEAALRLTENAAQTGLISYFALADQDDIWHPQKLARLLDEMLSLETNHTSEPALVHGDLRVVDENGREIAPSMASYQGLRPELDSLAAQLISNTVTGCTALMNRALLELSTPVPPAAIMHDWWISLVASAFGRRVYLEETLADYRQHGNNTIGAKEWTQRHRYQMKPGLASLPKNIYHVMRVLVIMSQRMFDDEHNEAFQNTARQAKAFKDYFGHRLPLGGRITVRFACGMGIHFPPLQRLLFKTLRHL
ncbi:glycosyltransferase family 2 protein [Hydrogenophaga sp.]|uniref:glycosyltransferase family 2 protein n=1 Tax=Hydrogenophaga sp. TaxID=1904254 RepID=UPI00271C1E2D|nr:glycosyltransferase family 2 protein [Hydrogenophaga sp.]MDO8903919.1 glycosyltransferase family 2 protein [Hydrogenophaga sp.]